MMTRRRYSDTRETSRYQRNIGKNGEGQSEGCEGVESAFLDELDAGFLL